jgi:hypothetical protein
MESFCSFLKDKFDPNRFHLRIQPIPRARVRTTDRNFIITVPGRSSEQIILVAHYDTWAGFSRCAPGADDNTSGEEVLKHYLLMDLCSANPPPLTHVYLFSGSEECGTRGLISQLGVTIGMYLISYAVTAADPFFFLLALPFAPLACYRFGITGTKEFVTKLTHEEKTAIKAAIAVDSVGEGRLYILENEMGANFIRALFPYEGSRHLNDLLKKGAHLNHIKYNTHLAGGTTDSVAFLEERALLHKDKTGAHIPAAALITMTPGKSSPYVFGGKLHTRNDTPDRVYPEPIAETLTILDHAFEALHGGTLPETPRTLGEHHYARIYRRGEKLFVAMKDAIESNRRNINTVYRVSGSITNKEAVLKVEGITGWGVEPMLDREVGNQIPGAIPVPVETMTIRENGKGYSFLRKKSSGRQLLSIIFRLRGEFGRLIGRYSFLSMFVLAFIVAYAPNTLIELAIRQFPSLIHVVGTYWILSAISVTLLQILVLVRLFTRELPAAMDNSYRHLNRSDNLSSLIRTP